MGLLGPAAGLGPQRGRFTVIGFDSDLAKVAALNHCESYTKHIGAGRVAAATKHDRFRASAEFSGPVNCGGVLTCVPTPLGHHREPVLSFVINNPCEVARRVHNGQPVVLEPTTYPGTTEEDVRPVFEETGLPIHADFLLAFSPEREDPSDPDVHAKSIPEVVGGVSRRPPRL